MTLRTLRNANAPTLKDLARIAGVSPITASRALHRPELVPRPHGCAWRRPWSNRATCPTPWRAG